MATKRNHYFEDSAETIATAKADAKADAKLKAKKIGRVVKEKGSSTKKAYVTNAQLLEAIAADKITGKLSNRLAGYLHMIAEKYSYSPSFAKYSFREDMVSIAVVNLVANWHKFDPAKSDNPFAFYTTAAYRSFLQFLADEKKHREIRDNLLIDAGASPSYSFQEKTRTGVTHDDTAFRTSASAEE